MSAISSSNSSGLWCTSTVCSLYAGAACISFPEKQVFVLVQMPGPDIVRSIYYQMIQGHLSQFEPDVARMAAKLTDATIDLHKTVMNNFLPSSVKFHYQFNLREMSNITQVSGVTPKLMLGSASRFIDC